MKKIFYILLFIIGIYIVVKIKPFSKIDTKKKGSGKEKGKFSYNGNTYDVSKTIIEEISTDGIRWCYYDVPNDTARQVVLNSKTNNTDWHADLNGCINGRKRVGLDFCGGGTCNNAQINRRRNTLVERLRNAGYYIIRNRDGKEYNKICKIIKNT